MSGKIARRFLPAGLALSAMLGAAAPVTAELRVAGWIERIALGEEGLILSAKLDTGADTSSLHAPEVRWFTRDGAHWVAFEVEGQGGRKVRFERKVVRVAQIKRRRGEPPLDRPTVLMGVCLGHVYRVTEVNLADRSRFKQPFLVGRNFLAHHFTVDSARTYTVEPDCAETRRR
jgi:hypothetical protein